MLCVVPLGRQAWRAHACMCDYMRYDCGMSDVLDRSPVQFKSAHSKAVSRSHSQVRVHRLPPI